MKTLHLTALIALAFSSPVFAQDGPREKIREPENRPGPAPADNERRDRPNRDDLRAMLEKSRHELDEAAKSGRQDEAEQIKHRIARLENALRDGDGGDRERGEKRQPPERPDIADARGRLQHLQQAIEQLHAAGMHEPADRLAEQAREMKRQLAGANEAKRPDGEKCPDAERQIAELREGLMNLQRHQQEMQKRLEELSRERR